MRFMKKLVLSAAAVLLAAPVAEAGPIRRLLGCQPAPVQAETTCPCPTQTRTVQYSQPVQPVQYAPTYQPQYQAAQPSRPLVQAVYQTVQAAANVPAAAVYGVGQFLTAPRTCGPNGCR